MLRILLLAFALGASAAPAYSTGTSSDVSGLETKRKCEECVDAEGELIKAIEAHDDASTALLDAENDWSAAIKVEAGELNVLGDRETDTSNAEAALERAQSALKLAKAAEAQQRTKYEGAQDVRADRLKDKNARHDDLTRLEGPLKEARETAARECAEMRGERAETTEAPPPPTTTTTEAPTTTTTTTTTKAPTTEAPFESREEQLDSGDKLTLKTRGWTPIQQQGTAFGSGSLGGYCTATNKIHCFQNINDLKKGNSHSWIPGPESDAYAGVKFATPKRIVGIGLSRDDTPTPQYHDRNGMYAIQLKKQNGDVVEYSATTQKVKRVIVSTKPQDYIEVRVKPAKKDQCLDELEIFTGP